VSDHVVTGIFTLLGVALGLFGERWVRRRGDVRCSIDSWQNVTDTGIPNEERKVEATFLNEKDVNAVVWNIQVVFHKEGQDPFCPTLTFSDGPSRGQVVGVLNLPPWVAVTRRMKVSLYYPDDLQKAKEADRAEFVATIAGVGKKREELRPPWHQRS
jgi:hypothetical protein